MKFFEKTSKSKVGSKENPGVFSLEENKEKKEKATEFSKEDKDQIKEITLGIESVSDEVKQSALDDVIRTLESGHPLNKIFRNEEGDIQGYIAFLDLNPHEAYIKYMGTDGEVDANIITEIKDIVEKAQTNNYTKLHFHGWNKRLNNVLTRFGFKHTRTDSMGGYNVDYFEMDLKTKDTPYKTQEALRDKFKQQIILETNKALKMVGDRINLAETSYQNITQKLQNTELSLNEIQQLVLKLKITRYFQNNKILDENTLIDAIVESPNFLNSPKGSLHRLFEIHEQKTLVKIAESRKKRAEIKGGEVFNPYEALFETSSGNYFMARLLNMPHLEEESNYMEHCVGTSDSYINKIKKGEFEILSFRNTPKIVDNKLEVDRPILTIEYDLKNKTIEQIKGHSDELLNGHEKYFWDFVESLKKLKGTKNDKGENREFVRINDLDNVELKKDTILTENGEVGFKDYNPANNEMVLKANIEVDNNSTWEDIEKISQIPNIEINLSEIKDEYKEKLTSFVGSIIDYSTNYLYHNLNSIGGYLDLESLNTAENLKFPDSVGGDLYLQMLTTAENLKLPDSVGGGLYLGSLTTAENLKLPDSVGGDLYLQMLTTAENLKLPDSVGGNLNLQSLTTAENLKLPDSVGGNLNLGSLTTAENLKLPDSVGGYLSLRSLTTAENLKLPDSVRGDLYLGSLTTAENLKLPDSVGGNLNLGSLTTAENLKLPDSVGGSIYNNLTEEDKESLRNKYPHLANNIR
jgi:hypothetical protein